MQKTRRFWSWKGLNFVWKISWRNLHGNHDIKSCGISKDVCFAEWEKWAKCIQNWHCFKLVPKKWIYISEHHQIYTWLRSEFCELTCFRNPLQLLWILLNSCAFINWSEAERKLLSETKLLNLHQNWIRHTWLLQLSNPAATLTRTYLPSPDVCLPSLCRTSNS